MSLYKGSATEQVHDAAYLSWELEPEMSRDEITLAANTPAMVAGTIVAVDATKNFVAFTGAETDLAIMMYDSELDAANAQQAVVTRYHSVVSETYMDWGAATGNQAQIDAAKAAMWANNRVKVKSTTGPTVT